MIEYLWTLKNSLSWRREEKLRQGVNEFSVMAPWGALFLVIFIRRKWQISWGMWGISPDKGGRLPWLFPFECWEPENSLILFLQVVWAIVIRTVTGDGSMDHVKRDQQGKQRTTNEV
jgi:hypothetical protein